MIKPGDRVTLFNDMRRNATVVSLKKEKSNVWYVGGTSGTKTFVLIEFDDGERATFPLNDVMPLH